MCACDLFGQVFPVPGINNEWQCLQKSELSLLAEKLKGGN